MEPYPEHWPAKLSILEEQPSLEGKKRVKLLVKQMTLGELQTETRKKSLAVPI